MWIARKLKVLLASAAVIASNSSVSAHDGPEPHFDDCTYYEEAWDYVQRINDVDGYVAFVNTFACAPEAESQVTEARGRLLDFAAEGEIPPDTGARLVLSTPATNFVGRLFGVAPETLPLAVTIQYAG